MSRTEGRREVRIELDGIVGLGELEAAALAFAREAPAQLSPASMMGPPSASGMGPRVKALGICVPLSRDGGPATGR